MAVAVDHIVFEHKFTRVPNRLLTCNRLSKYQILLAGMLNLKNMRMERKPPVPNPNLLTISKKELRCVLNHCIEDTIDKQLRGLRKLGVVADFSKQGGSEGNYVVVLADNLEDNPYVLMDIAEKQVLKDCRVTVNNSAKDYLNDLMSLIKTAAESVEADYVAKLTQDIGALDEFKSYLKSVIVEARLGTFDEEQIQPSNMNDNNNAQSLVETVYVAFCTKYLANTGREHPVIKPTALTQISKVIDYCGGDKDMIYWFVDKFFEVYHAKDPKTALFANDGILSDLHEYWKTGKAPTVYGAEQRTKSSSVVKAEQVQEAKQDRKGLPNEEVFKRLEGK